MVKSAPMRDHSIVIKPRRRGAGGMALLLVLLLSAGVIALGFVFFAPAKLALFQERAIGVLHGGVSDSEERTFIDAMCARDRRPRHPGGHAHSPHYQLPRWHNPQRDLQLAAFAYE